VLPRTELVCSLVRRRGESLIRGSLPEGLVAEGAEESVRGPGLFPRPPLSIITEDGAVWGVKSI